MARRLRFVGMSGLGVVAVARHQEFFEPVWGTEGRAVYLIQRGAFGVVRDMGWEFFSPPAYAYMPSDRFSLHRLDLLLQESWRAAHAAGALGTRDLAKLGVDTTVKP